MNAVRALTCAAVLSFTAGVFAYHLAGLWLARQQRRRHYHHHTPSTRRNPQ